MQKSKGFVSAVMFVMTLAMVACASTRTQKSAGEQVDDSVTTGRVKAALIADPVCARLTPPQVRKMALDLLRANAALLPQFRLPRR